MVNFRSTCAILVCYSILLLITKADSLQAQSSTGSGRVAFWLSGGLGASSLGSFAGNVGGSIQYGRRLISLRATANAETGEIFGGGDEFFDLGLLVGLASSGAQGLASVAVGIARVTGSRYEGEPGLFGSGRRVQIQPVIGLPIEAQFFLKLSRAIGLGVYLFANFNAQQPFGGITLNIQVGKLR